MICHLAECLMDRALDCRWDATASEELFRGAAVKEGVMRMGYVGELRPLNFLSQTVNEIETVEEAAMQLALSGIRLCLDLGNYPRACSGPFSLLIPPLRFIGVRVV